MSSEQSAAATLPPVDLRKGVNGLDKVVLREARGSSAEVLPPTPSFLCVRVYEDDLLTDLG